MCRYEYSGTSRATSAKDCPTEVLKVLSLKVSFHSCNDLVINREIGLLSEGAPGKVLLVTVCKTIQKAKLRVPVQIMDSLHCGFYLHLKETAEDVCRSSALRDKL